MSDTQVRSAFGHRVRELRKRKKWTQKDLAAKLSIRFGQLNKYECGVNVPPIEKLADLAAVLDTTVDYLVSGNAAEARPLHNVRLLERFHALAGFTIEDQETVITLIDGLILKRQVEGAMSRFDRKAG